MGNTSLNPRTIIN